MGHVDRNEMEWMGMYVGFLTSLLASFIVNFSRKHSRKFLRGLPCVIPRKHPRMCLRKLTCKQNVSPITRFHMALLADTLHFGARRRRGKIMNYLIWPSS